MHSPRAPTITLLSDFGLQDHYVAVLKLVILGIAPEARLIDVTHDVRAHDVRQAAYILAQIWRWSAPGTAHLAVVDPGVGSDRPVLAGSWDGRIIVAPDNGLISLVHASSRVACVHRVTARELMRPVVSATFHGRDIMAPVIARLATGAPLAEVGPPAHPEVLWPPPVLARRGDTWQGEVVAVDRFGNAVTNIPAEDPAALAAATVRVRGRQLPVVGCYLQAPPGEPVALCGSEGTLEIAIDRGSAAAALGLEVGDAVSMGP